MPGTAGSLSNKTQGGMVSLCVIDSRLACWQAKVHLNNMDLHGEIANELQVFNAGMTCSCNHFCLGRQHLPSTIQKRGFVQEWGILIPKIYRFFMFLSPYFPANWPFRGIPGFIRCPFSRSVPLGNQVTMPYADQLPHTFHLLVGRGALLEDLL